MSTTKRYRVRKVEAGSVIWTDLENDTLAVPCEFSNCNGIAGMKGVLTYYLDKHLTGVSVLRTTFYLCYGHTDKHRLRLDAWSALRSSICGWSGCDLRARWLVFTGREPIGFHLCEMHAAAEGGATFEIPLSSTGIAREPG